ncbi:transferase TIGR04331 family [Leptospira kmetyi]|uniref:transferase TIGR04331 family n=1 Tax=Leptospira kmetyi TaxID=408139 RepID=UPI00039057E4|nr:transferase TIGR04331 family [Leptospira kmetyi]EQA55065.1 transferase, TIGR04331 family [Leptospira kmetyi serovar Malaysia str. Bejo-Iso9]
MDERTNAQNNFYVLRAEGRFSNEISLNSFENQKGVAISKELIERFSRTCAELSNQLIQNIANQVFFDATKSIPLKSIEILIRRSLLPIVHFYWNQVMRIHLLASENSNLSIYSSEQNWGSIEIPEEFDKRILDQNFNEYFILYLSRIWKFLIQPSESLNWINVNSKVKASLKNSPKNNLFSLGKSVKFKNRLIRFIERIFERVYPFPRFPVLTFANSETALRLRGMYLFHFRWIVSRWQFPQLQVDSKLRESVFQKGLKIDSGLIDFLKEIGLSDEKIKSAFELFKEFVISYFPVQFLEGLNENYEFASRCFRKNDRKAIFSSGDGDTFSTYIIAFAKGNGYKVVKAQHGGHYGYYRDNRPALDIELPATDVFLTWGWTRMHEEPQLRHIECIPMPSPWLSERKKYWSDYRIDTPKKYDLLWMPQMMKRFIGAPQGASSIRRDVIQEFSRSMIDIAKGIKRFGLTAFVKPYNALTVSLLENTYRRVQEEGSDSVVISDTYDKGLTLELLGECSIVLWDQPGTGFLECLSCGIPTLVLWDRIYCEEEEWTRQDFSILEKHKIVHRSVETLLEEASLLTNNPVAWMNESSRKAAVNLFCNRYALTSADWSADWKVYLKSLK